MDEREKWLYGEDTQELSPEEKAEQRVKAIFKNIGVDKEEQAEEVLPAEPEIAEP